MVMKESASRAREADSLKILFTPRLTGWGEIYSSCYIGPYKLAVGKGLTLVVRQLYNIIIGRQSRSEANGPYEADDY